MDDEEDYALAVWAGQVPITPAYDPSIPDPRLTAGTPCHPALRRCRAGPADPPRCGRIRHPPLPVLELHSSMDQRWRIADLALLIVATGYRLRQLELHDDCGIPLVAEVEFGCRGRGPIRNLLGPGHAIRRYGSYRVGVNVFHGEAASRILKECELGARVTAPGAAAATIRGRSTRSTW